MGVREGGSGTELAVAGTGTVAELARGTHTLLVECSFPDDAPVLGHLAPSGAARMARESGA